MTKQILIAIINDLNVKENILIFDKFAILHCYSLRITLSPSTVSFAYCFSNMFEYTKKSITAKIVVKRYFCGISPPLLGKIARSRLQFYPKHRLFS